MQKKYAAHSSLFNIIVVVEEINNEMENCCKGDKKSKEANFVIKKGYLWPIAKRWKSSGLTIEIK